jgi:hypothetical protein
MLQKVLRRTAARPRARVDQPAPPTSRQRSNKCTSGTESEAYTTILTV